MLIRNYLFEYIQKHGIDKYTEFTDGASINPVKFPLAILETHGAILFADLPGYSRLASKMEPVECAYMVSHFFAWYEGETRRKFGGIIDKFIGDEVMVVFPHSECQLPPLKAAMLSARAMLENDPCFNPKIGIAHGCFAVAIIGTLEVKSVTAMGNTVNLAARCAGSICAPHTIKIAIDDIGIAHDVFESDVWDISSPITFKPENMLPVQVIEVRRTTDVIRSSDYYRELKKKIIFARENGAIKKDV